MLEGYCWPQSVLPGEPVGLSVSSSGPFGVEVAREGTRREVVWRADAVAGSERPIPATASSDGCGWPAVVEIPVDDGWRSGYYSVRLTGSDHEADAFFVVRPARPAPILLVLSTATYAAYNDWGGPSLYTGGTRVSFERPLAPGFLRKTEPAERKAQSVPDREALAYFAWAGEHGLSPWSGGSGWWTWERPFVAWAEEAGHEIDVAVSQDLERHPEVLDGHRLFLSVGHDEYWSWGMRDAVEGFVAGGGNAAFFTGNTCWWQVRFEDDGRAMTCFKYRADEDPVLGTVDESRLTGTWADRRIGRPEAAMTGLSFSRGGYSRYGLGVPRASGAYTVCRPDHWAFEGTDLRYGDALGVADAIVGYEVDGCELELVDGLPTPTHEDGAPDTLEVLAIAPARLWSEDEQPSRYGHEPGELEHVAMAVFGEGWERQVHRVEHNHAVVGCYDVPGGGTVFNAGCTDWTYGIGGGDPTVRRITRNVLKRLSS
ncbi:MAG TPA: N,N-dimethylformamidase beta subunit family domain-containing protein [Actinomycetota bacterium]|nr:N,N-dimethylformamidase beta subunit family domain-containing protein [Actinomycetota bacterium]